MHKRFTPWIRSNLSVYSILLLSSKGPQISLAWKPSHGLRQPYSPRSCLGTFPIFQVPISQVYPSYSPIPSEIINVWFPRANYPIFLSENRYFIIPLSLLKKNALLVSHFPLSTSQDFVPNSQVSQANFPQGPVTGHKNVLAQALAQLIIHPQVEHKFPSDPKAPLPATLLV